MRRLVADASVLAFWFLPVRSRDERAARGLRRRFEAGELDVAIPTILRLELLNAAGRRWGWPEAKLIELAAALSTAPFTVLDPRLEAVAVWVAQGLTAYDAAYVALAEDLGVGLATLDREILWAAPQIATTPSAV